jgi:hypothetical protein
MKVNFNKVLNHSLQIKSCKEIIQEQKEMKKATYKRSGSELLTIGIVKGKQLIQAKMIDEKYEEFKRDVGRMEQYMISYIHKLSGKLIRFADDQRKTLKQTAADKNSEFVPGNMPKFEYSKTRIGNFKRATQVLLSLIHIKPDEKPLDHAFEEIERLTGVIIDLEKEISELKNGKPEPPVEVPVIEVVDFGKLTYYEKGEYVKNLGIDTGYLRNITGYVMTKDGGYILVCTLHSVCDLK